MATSESTITKNVSACDQAFPERSDAHQKQLGSHSEAPDLTKDDVVAFTSRLIAAARAIESRRPDRLINDYFAELLIHSYYDPVGVAYQTWAGDEVIHSYEETVGMPMRLYKFGASSTEEEKDGSSIEAGGSISPSISVDGTEAPITTKASDSGSRRLAIRTRFGDDFFEDCARPPRSIKQIVSLGAGMDTRGYRLRADPGTTVFEVDQALVLAYKRKILSGSSLQSMTLDKNLDSIGGARVIEVQANLGQTGWEGDLIEAGFDPTLPSAWILEGLTMYLDEHENVKLSQIIANLSSPRNAFFASLISEEWDELSKSCDNDIYRSFKWGSDDPEAFFEGHFPANWSFKCVMFGMPGEFPDGADYSLGYKGKGIGLVIGYAA